MFCSPAKATCEAGQGRTEAKRKPAAASADAASFPDPWAEPVECPGVRADVVLFPFHYIMRVYRPFLRHSIVAAEHLGRFFYTTLAAMARRIGKNTYISEVESVLCSLCRPETFG